MPAGGYLQPHPTDHLLRVLPRYPVPSWQWGSAVPDIELPAAVTTRESIEWLEKPRYNRVFVSGTSQGLLGQITRQGSAGDLVAPMVTDALATHADALRQRGIAVLSDTGRQANVTLRLPVLPETGVIAPGQFVRYVDGATTRLGIVRSTSVDVGRPSCGKPLESRPVRNPYKLLLDLLPQAPLQVGTVLSAEGGVATIELPGGGIVQAPGEAGVGDRVFARDGAIEGNAPDLQVVIIEV